MDRVKIVQDKTMFSFVKNTLWLKVFAWRLIKRNQIDFYFSANGFLPILPSRVKTMGIIHDLNYKMAPDTMTLFHYVAHYLFLKRDTKKLNYVITNTYATQKKINHYLHKKVDLVLTPPKIDGSFRKRDASEVKNKLRTLGINYPYFLSVATQEPRKNIDKTVQAFISVKKEGCLPDYKLLLVGDKGWRNKQIEKLLAENTADIVQLGYVSKEFLLYLYNGAEAFLFPSQYEGFGAPVREAIASGCKVIASDIEELREVGNENVCYVNPEDENQYKEALKNIIYKKNTLIDSFEGQHSMVSLCDFINNN
jgi:glycosyltransferase involved in cell wall biosynthesis